MDQRNKQDGNGGAAGRTRMTITQCRRCGDEGTFDGKGTFICQRCQDSCRDCGDVCELVPNRSYCRECWNQRRRDHREAHPEAYVEPQRRRTEKYAADESLRIVARQRTKEWNEKNPRRRKDLFLRTTYNITLEAYEERLQNQNDECKTCYSGSPGAGHTYFSVDHDHSCCPGKRSCGKCIRGLLCSRCNLVLGPLNDDPVLLRSLADYIEEWRLNMVMANMGETDESYH